MVKRAALSFVTFRLYSVFVPALFVSRNTKRVRGTTFSLVTASQKGQVGDRVADDVWKRQTVEIRRRSLSREPDAGPRRRGAREGVGGGLTSRASQTFSGDRHMGRGTAA